MEEWRAGDPPKPCGRPKTLRKTTHPVPDLLPLWEKFYDEDPFEDFPVESYPYDLQGWGSTHPAFAHLIERVQPALVVEVGTWKGRSAVHMARIVKSLGLDCQILCIDTGLGAPEHILKREYFASLAMVNGFPTLFHTFMSNVIQEGHADIITPLPQTSENGAVLLRRLGLRPDLIYVDAAHEYEPVLRDLRAFGPLLNDGGILFGDDYPKAHGVVRAAHEYAIETGARVAAGGGKFVIVDAVDDGLARIGLSEAELPLR